MEPIRLAVALVAALYFLSSCCILAQNLTAVKCLGTLPTGRSRFTLLYDKNDSIYLFGGGSINDGGQAPTDDVVKYSISQDTAEIVGHLPHTDYNGGAVMDKFGNILYFSMWDDLIYQYFPELRSFVNKSSLEGSSAFLATITPDTDTALLFDGFSGSEYATFTNITSLNMNTLEVELIGRLPKVKNMDFPSAIWVEEQNAAYIFNNGKVQKYFRSSNRTETLSFEVPVITGSSNYAAVYDGRFGYLIGEIKDGNPGQSLLQFDPDTETFTLIPVEDYVTTHSGGAVYVEKLNRIYTFGGYAGGHRDDIYYIELDPVNRPPTTTTTEDTPISTMDPEIFNCVGRRYSNFPYPGDCTKFVICREDHGYPFDCPEPLHFDPFDRHCTFPEKAGCE